MAKGNLSLHSVKVPKVIECETIAFPPNVRNPLLVQQAVELCKCIVVVFLKMSVACRATANYSELDS